MVFDIQKEADAQKIAGRLIWSEVPFEVMFSADGNPTVYMIVRDSTKLEQAKRIVEDYIWNKEGEEE